MNPITSTSNRRDFPGRFPEIDNPDCDQPLELSIMASRLLASNGGLLGADDPQPNPSASCERPGTARAIGWRADA